MTHGRDTTEEKPHTLTHATRAAFGPDRSRALPPATAAPKRRLGAGRRVCARAIRTGGHTRGSAVAAGRPPHMYVFRKEPACSAAASPAVGWTS